MSGRELRRFGVTLAIPLALLATVAVWRGHILVPALLGGPAAALAVAALLAPGLLRPAHKLWMALTHALGWFNTRLLLAVAYFLVMTPTGLVMRLVRHDPLDRRLRDRSSYWIQRIPQANPRLSMERHF